MAARVPVPATLHLDHCPDRAVIAACMEAGWNSVLFDASTLSYEENLAQTRALVADRAPPGSGGGRRTGVDRGRGGRHRRHNGAHGRAARQGLGLRPRDGNRQFAPAIGTAHGVYRGEPKVDFARVSEIVAGEPLPLVVHGGTGLSRGTFQDLIGRGAVKVNISTQVKITFADAFRDYLADRPQEYDPLRLLVAVKREVQDMVAGYMRIFGSMGKAA